MTTMTQTKIYRNDTTGYTVTLIDNGRGATVKDSNGYSFPMVGSDYPYAGVLAASRARFGGAVEVPTPAPRQMASPLAEQAQVRMARPLATGAAGTVGEPTLPQARCLWFAAHGNGIVRRGPASWTGAEATYAQMVAMERRGWMLVTEGRNMALITNAGRNALAAYVAKHGPVL